MATRKKTATEGKLDGGASNDTRKPESKSAGAKKIGLCAAALEYVDKFHWRVFPVLEVTQTGGCECGDPLCDRPGKHPAIKEWNKAATTDRVQIKKWWDEHPGRGIGIATGEASGLTVLDVDGEEGVETL